MLKKSLLFLLLLALGLPWAANAQNRTVVTIGDGTSGQNYPLPGYYGWNYDVFLYTPTAAAALEADCDISSIAFNVKTNSTTTGAEMYIWVKDVDADYALASATTFSEYTDGATQVYENDDFSSTAGWNTFAFTRDFSHEGGKALLVAVRAVGCSTSGGCSRACYYTSASNTYWYKRADGTDPGTNVSGSVTSSRANIQLDLTYTGAVCLTPSGLTPSNLTDNSATLSWTENGSATAWVLQYGTDNEFGTYTEENVSTTPSFGLTNLTALTTYYARVRPDCDTEGSHWSNTLTFITTAYAEPVGDSWSDDFEGASFGWELINGTLTNQWAWGTAANNGGTHGLYISNDGGTSNAYSHSAAIVYATKLLNFTEGKFEFAYEWKANGESSYDYLRVALVPASVTLTAGTTPSGFSSSGLPTGWIALDGGSKLNQVTAWQSKSVAVNMTAGNYYLVVAWRNDNSGGTQPPAAVDNVSITRVACPYDVTGLAVSDITTNGATLTWTAGEAEQWQVAYSTASSFEGATEEIVSAATYTMSNLASSTTYYVKVRAYCGGEDYGSWSSVVSFPTACEAMDLADEDFSENFDDITLPSTYSPSTRTLPICWNFINTSTYSSNAVHPTMYYYDYTDYSHSTPNSLRLYCSYSSNSNYDPQDQYAILPAMENMEGKQITLWARGHNASSTFKIGMMTDPTDASTFEMIAEQTLTTSYDEYSFILGEGNYVAIMMEAANSSNSTKGVYIDDITITDAPTCLKPTDLEATASGLSATLTWVSEVGSYEIAITTDDAADPTDDIVGTATEATFTMNELALGDYYFWVRANCGNDGYSDWAGPVSFHIGYCVPTPSNVDGNGISNVTFGMGDNIVNNDTPKAYYADYTSEIGAVQAGVEASVDITYAHSYTYGTFIWVDLNNDLDFDDEGEILYYGMSAGSVNPHTLNATIIIPATQTPGDYVMRIGGADSGFDTYESADPCYTGSWACFQDYTLRVLEAPACLIPTGLAVNYTAGTTAEVTWVGTAETYNIDVNGTVIEGVTNPYTLEELELATTYTVMVQANCENDVTSDWSNAVSFMTDLCLAEDMCEISYSFTDQYNDSWNGAYMNIVDAETGEMLYELTMPDVTGPYEGSFAVCYGRDIQFVWVSGSYPRECGYVFTHNGETILEKETGATAPSAGVVLTYTVNCGFETFTLDIAQYTSGQSNGWYLIASPVSVDIESNTMVSGTYDLYRFNPTAEKEWENYKNTEHSDFTTLEVGRGYLYANGNDNGIQLSFTGVPANNGEVTAAYTGWNLIGNPLSTAATVDKDYYRMNDTHTGIMIDKGTGNVAVMEGIFVNATADETITFTSASKSDNRASVVMNLSQNRGGVIDRAIVRFGNSNTLPKFQLFENSTKLYIAQDGKDYAIVKAEMQGEMPVSFKAAKNGTYTLSFSTENVEMGYLHLIDNLTGNDVDLLATPSYSFEANTTDYASRFRLVFSAGNANDSQFAFISNGEIVLDGQGTAQVFDVTGRMISSHYNATRIATENMAAGVYVIRLINGENVKTQKIIVK